MTGHSSVIRHLTPGGSIDYQLRRRLFLIGCNADNDVVLRGKGVAPIMMKIEPCEDGYRCSATTKTPLSINGKRVKSATLAPGDSISIGKERFVFERASFSAAASPGQRNSILDNFRRFVDAVGRERQLQPLLQNLMGILLELTGGTDIFIFKLDPEGKPQVFESNGSGSAEVRFSDTIVQTVLDRKEGIFIPNALADPAYKNASSISDLKLRSILCTPILSAGKCVGVIYIGSNSPAVSFTKDDLDVVAIYAAIAGMLFHHIDFIADQQSTIDRFTGAIADDGIIAASPSMLHVLRAVQAIASTNVTVLLEGETGTGKNRIAELIHRRSPRASAPFVVVNCSALHGELLESELFGHKKGSFTGAVGDHEGLFLAARGGSLLLDEIGELELPLQAKLLRTLETGAVRPIGSAREMPVDARVICATNRDLKTMVDEGGFRADLFYRINQFPIAIPPLRERDEDVVPLAYLLLNRYRSEYPQKEILDFHPATLHYMRTHQWPGNIRELANAIHRAVLMCRGPLVSFESGEPAAASGPVDFESASRHFQKEFLEKAIIAAGGNKETAARNVGLSRSTFYRYLAYFKI
ncbi:MAG: sigma 54-interacting transcriptional regulator [Chitinispirillaceae bacterium]|nr:sigma 54-interacting transcriptional regulator [Chitinispirillaceae bacterium]